MIALQFVAYSHVCQPHGRCWWLVLLFSARVDCHTARMGKLMEGSEELQTDVSQTELQRWLRFVWFSSKNYL